MGSRFFCSTKIKGKCVSLIKVLFLRKNGLSAHPFCQKIYLKKHKDSFLLNKHDIMVRNVKHPWRCIFQYRCSELVVKLFEKYLWWSVIFSKFASNTFQLLTTVAEKLYFITSVCWTTFMEQLLTLCRMGFFGAAHGWGGGAGQNDPPPP